MHTNAFPAGNARCSLKTVEVRERGRTPPGRLFPEGADEDHVAADRVVTVQRIRHVLRADTVSAEMKKEEKEKPLEIGVRDEDDKALVCLGVLRKFLYRRVECFDSVVTRSTILRTSTEKEKEPECGRASAVEPRDGPCCSADSDP